MRFDFIHCFSDGDNFRFSISKLPSWARNQFVTNPAASEGDNVQATSDSRLASGKWAEVRE